MKAWCAAAIVQVLGYMPQPGTEIVVPRSIIMQHSVMERSKARTCAYLHGIKYRIAKDQ